MTTATADPKPTRMRGVALVALTLFMTSFIAATYGFGVYLFPVIMSDMRADLGFSYGDAGIITAGSQVGFLLAAFISGTLAPRVGGGRVIIASMVICFSALLLLHVAERTWVVGVLLFFLGGMAASAWTPMVEVCQRFIARRHRGKVLGLISSGTSYGVFINGLLAPYMVQNHHWRDTWLAVGAGTAVLTLAAAVFLGAYGVLARPPADANEEDAQGLRALTAAGRRLRTLLMRKTILIWSLMALNGFACISYQTYLSSYLRDELGYSVTLAGSLWTLIGFVGMGGGFAMGALADRITIRATLTITYALLAISSLIVLLHPNVATLYAASVTFGLAFYAIFGLCPAYISHTTTEKQSTVVFGIGNILLGLGSMLGNLAGGSLKEFTGTFEWTYILVALAAVGSAALTAPLPNERHVDADADARAARPQCQPAE